MKWNWNNFLFNCIRSFFLALAIDITNPDLTFWYFAGAVFCWLVAIEMTVHLIRRERIAEGKENP